MNIMFGEPEEPDGDGSATNGEDERVRVNHRDAALVVVAATAGGCGKPNGQFFEISLQNFNKIERLSIPLLASFPFFLLQHLLKSVLIVSHHQPWSGADAQMSRV